MEESIMCDICGDDAAPGEAMHCGVCDINLCEQCGDQDERDFDDDEPACTHELERYMQSPLEETAASDDLLCDCCGKCIPSCSVSARCDVCEIDLCETCGNEPSREFLDDEPPCGHSLVWYEESEESDTEANMEGCDVCGADVHPDDVYCCEICDITVCEECSANKPIMFSDDEEPCGHTLSAGQSGRDRAASWETLPATHIQTSKETASRSSNKSTPRSPPTITCSQCGLEIRKTEIHSGDIAATGDGGQYIHLECRVAAAATAVLAESDSEDEESTMKGDQGPRH